MSVKIGVISLGCSKNRVDTETMMGCLARDFEFVGDIESADIVIINTCSFINDAKEESINVILEAEQQKKFGNLKGIIVTGCMSERYREELSSLMPSVDAFLGVNAYGDIKEAVFKILDGEKYMNFGVADVPEHYMQRIMTTQKPTAYVKIAEGCNNNCSYCVIPSIRGRLKSRKIEDVLLEIENLAKEGYSEIVLIAQDTAVYGMDIYGSPKIVELMDKGAQIPGVKWLRILYCYPEHITPELIDVMVKHENIPNYIDMPVQHFSDEILKKMYRKNTLEKIKSTVKMIRSKDNDFVLRTTLITGFPTETRKMAVDMVNVLKELKFNRVGVFKYSQEEGTPAAKMDGQIEEEEKDFRQQCIVNEIAHISLELGKKRVGKTYEVLVEGYDDESGLYYGRSFAETPEADGKIFIEAEKELAVGEFYNVKITQAYEYDLRGELV